MANLWDSIKKYYETIGRMYHVSPGLFVLIHIVATPLFIASAAWIVNNFRRKKSLYLPVIVSILIFNAANIYLILFGKNLPLYLFVIIAFSTILSAYISFKRIKRKSTAIK